MTGPKVVVLVHVDASGAQMLELVSPVGNAEIAETAEVDHSEVLELDVTLSTPDAV